MGHAVKGISASQSKAVSDLAPHLDEHTYLGGGVAVALRLLHRTSRDLDFFTPAAFDSAEFTERMSQLQDVRIVSQAPGTVYLEVHGVPASIIRYRYRLLEPPEKSEALTVPLASLKDLICMKLSAIAGRGAIRDFWDLHAMLTSQAMSLGDALDAFRAKYPSVDVGHVVRSLVYFVDADAEPRPQGLDEQTWTAIKRDLCGKVKALSPTDRD